MNEILRFEDLNLKRDLLEIIKKKGFVKPSEIQSKIIPQVLETKHDLIGVSQTGSGKTASFSIPILELVRFDNRLPKVIILAPTRELALQITAEMSSFIGKRRVNILTVYGGASINNQIKDLRRGVDIVVGTPGRVLDLIKRKNLELKNIEFFVLDEADEMLKMGFIEDVELILSKTPSQKRVLLFSATMPQKIKNLAKNYMKNQVVVEVEKKIDNKLNIAQKYIIVEQKGKLNVLKKIITSSKFFYGIIFCKMRSEVDQVKRELTKAGFQVDGIHGDIIQNKREKILKKFRDQKINILVATDVAARGIDVSNLTCIINHSLPRDLETYVHRIGRTGRAGKSGTAISFISKKQKFMVREIEKETNSKLERLDFFNMETQVPKVVETETKVAKQKQNINDFIKNSKSRDNRELAKELVSKYNSKDVVYELLNQIRR